MKQSEYTQWLDNIVSSVDELESSYKRRLSIMSAEYQKDIEDMLHAYKSEKHNLAKQLQELEDQLEQTQTQFKNAQRLYKSENVEHKITKDQLHNTRHELTVLTKSLHSQQPPAETLDAQD